MFKPRPVILREPTEPDFSSVPVGGSWLINMAPHLQPEDEGPITYLDAASQGWTQAQVDLLVHVLHVALDRYQRRVEDDEVTNAELGSETERLKRDTYNYRVKCPGCSGEMVVSLGVEDRVLGGGLEVANGVR